MAHSVEPNAANKKQQQRQLLTLLQVCIALLVASSCLALPSAVQAKHLDGHHYHHHEQLQQQQHAHHRRRLQRDSTSKILLNDTFVAKVRSSQS